MKIKWIVATGLIIASHVLPARELSTESVNRVIQAQQMVQNNKLTEAIDLLSNASPVRAYDKAYIDRMLGAYLWQANDPEGAIASLQAALSSQQLDEGMTRSAQRMLADLLLSRTRLKPALALYQKLIENPPKEEEVISVWSRIAQVNYLLQRWQPSLTALSRYQKAGGQKTLDTLSLKLSDQLHLGRLKEALVTSTDLISFAPDRKDFWIQKVAIALQAGDSGNALTTLQLAQLQPIRFEHPDWIMLAQLYAQNGIPERAARILANLDLGDNRNELIQVATYWQQAKEWQQAISAWKTVAEYDKQFYWQVAVLQMQTGDYRAALNSMDQIPGAGKSSKITLAKARALYWSGELNLAVEQAKISNQIQANQENKSWLNYLTRLKKRKANQS